MATSVSASLPSYYSPSVSPSTEIWIHADPEKTLYPLLAAGVPYTGQLLRRIQSALFHDVKGYALASFPPGKIPSSKSSKPWLVAYVDLFNAPDSQIWITSSLEQKGTYPVTATQSINRFRVDDNTKAIARAQLLQLFSFIDTHIFPIYARQLKELNSEASPSTKYNTAALHTGIAGLLLGEKEAESLTEIVILPRRYIIPMSNADCTLPKDYSYTNANGQEGIQPEHYALVNKVAIYKRSHHHMRTLAKTVTVYYTGDDPSLKPKNEGEPTAWIALTCDGTMTSAYTDPRHRGNNLGACLIRKLMHDVRTAKDDERIFRPVPGELNGNIDFFCEITITNDASNRLAAKVGGSAPWSVAYVTVEFDMRTRSLSFSPPPALSAHFAKARARL
ncbi:Methionine aminopeptidase 1 [Ascosphaera pollenicola]|nr:Methionine aminopeptidase 1 [Ascosphaera pollenicola]